MMRFSFTCIFFLIVSCYAIEDNSTTTAGPKTTTPAATVVPTTPPTPAPTPSPTPVPTTAPPPPTTTEAPATKPDKSAFNVTDGNLTCIEAEFGLQFKNLWNESSNVVVTKAVLDKKSSHCGNATQVLAFSFLYVKKNYSVVMTFQKSGDERFLSLIDVTQGSETVRINQTAFKLSGDKFYSCDASTDVTGNNVTAIFDHVKLSAFRTEESGNEVYVCVSDDTVNDMVPIAVGCALLALVVIVLIAYFIGRRRSRRLAYQSV